MQVLADLRAYSEKLEVARGLIDAMADPRCPATLLADHLVKCRAAGLDVTTMVQEVASRRALATCIDAGDFAGWASLLNFTEPSDHSAPTHNLWWAAGGKEEVASTMQEQRRQKLAAPESQGQQTFSMKFLEASVLQGANNSL
jgi:hypothetical protein